MGVDIDGGEKIKLTVIVPFRCESCGFEKKLFVPVECTPSAHAKGKMLICGIKGGAQSAVPKCDCGQEMKASGPGKLEVN